MSKPMPPCEIKFGYTAEGDRQVTYTFEGYTPSFTVIDCGPLLPSRADVKEVWRLANDPKELEPLRLVKDKVDDTEN